MSEITYHSVLQLAQQLTEREQLTLISQLANRMQIQKTAPTTTSSIFGKYAPQDNPNADEQVESTLREIRSDWENNLKDLMDDN